MDNNHSSINYPQKYIACLVFYEKIESYNKAYKKFLKFDSKDSIDNNTTINDYFSTYNDRISSINSQLTDNMFNTPTNNENFFPIKNESFENKLLINNLCSSTADNIVIKEKYLENSIIDNVLNDEDNLDQKINISETRHKYSTSNHLIDLKNIDTKRFLLENQNKIDQIYTSVNKEEKKNIFELSSEAKIKRNNPDTLYKEDLSDKRLSICNSNSNLALNNNPNLNRKNNSNSMEKNIKEMNLKLNNFFVNNGNKIKKIYAPKCICLVSLYPFCNEMLKILRGIYKYCCNTRLKKPVEKIIENLTIEVPLPPRGLYTINYQLSNETMTFSQNKMNELPYVSIDLEKIFINFKFEQIFEIYKHLLLETRLIFFSKDMSLLSPIIHGFVILTYPFKYPFNFITVIPEENFPILDNITPFIFGINQGYHKNFFEKHKLDISQFNYLVIDIDKRGIELNCPETKGERECNVKKILLNEFPELPLHYKKKLQEKLKEYINKIKSNTEKESKKKFIWSIRQLFYQFNCSIFLNYSKYLNLDYFKNKDMSIPSVVNLFKVEDYIKSNPVEDRPFYKKFINETQQFADFIYKRMIPKDSKEKLEFLLFDENITEKNNRKFMSKKVHTYFLQSQLYDFKQVYFVEKHRNLSEKEIEYFKNKENRKNALKYGVEVIINSKNINKNSNEINDVKSINRGSNLSFLGGNNFHNKINDEVFINYLFFPSLMTEFYFMNNLSNYIIPNNLSQSLEQINVDMVSKSHLSNCF